MSDLSDLSKKLLIAAVQHDFLDKLAEGYVEKLPESYRFWTSAVWNVYSSAKEKPTEWFRKNRRQDPNTTDSLATGELAI